MTRSRLVRQSLFIGILASILAACGDNTPTTDEVRSVDSGGAPIASTPDSHAATPADTTTPGPREITPIDPATGTMTITASGSPPVIRTFADVNGSIIEQAGGGETISRLQLEGHDDPVHFKIRLGGSAGEIAPGRYVVGDVERGVDATYENASVFYKSLGGASGTVSVTEITDNNAKGTFDLNLETIAEDPLKIRVQGSFDMRVQR
ncbi:MAG: hypothetical protein H7X80_02065 [bacterium]|nr:hypothetical protein [Candidatus Kapabacteria bacterium]